MAQIKNFRGLNNVSDPLRIGLGWLTNADNVNISDTGAISKREGYAVAQAGNITGIYTTLDHQRMYLVDAGTLRTFSGAVLRNSLSSAPMYWAEINGQVFFNNGTDSGVINQDNTVMDWEWPIPSQPTVSLVTGTLASGTYQVCCTFMLEDGRETGPSDPVMIDLAEGHALSISSIPHATGAATRVYIAPANSAVYQLAVTTTGSAMVWNFSNDALGKDLATDGTDPLPLGVSSIAVFKGRMYAAQYMPMFDQTVIWYSQPLGFHLFDLSSDFFMVPGEAVMLAPTDSALVVGTKKAIHAYNSDGITLLADYGVIPGQHWADDDNRILFWTSRGVCAAMPLTNLTEKYVSVAPGVRAGGCLVRSGGQKRYLSVIQQGGTAFNSF